MVIDDVRRQVAVDVVRGVTEVAVYRDDEVVAENALDDVVRRAHHVEILVSALYLGEHYLVDVEELVYDCHILSGLLLVPILELGEHIFIDVVGPVVDFEDVLAVVL